MVHPDQDAPSSGSESDVMQQLQFELLSALTEQHTVQHAAVRDTKSESHPELHLVTRPRPSSLRRNKVCQRAQTMIKIP